MFENVRRLTNLVGKTYFINRSKRQATHQTLQRKAYHIVGEKPMFSLLAIAEKKMFFQN